MFGELLLSTLGNKPILTHRLLRWILRDTGAIRLTSHWRILFSEYADFLCPIRQSAIRQSAYPCGMTHAAKVSRRTKFCRIAPAAYVVPHAWPRLRMRERRSAMWRKNSSVAVGFRPEHKVYGVPEGNFSQSADALRDPLLGLELST